MTVIAKPVIDRKYYILTENDEKIGNVEAVKDGYHLKINNAVTELPSLTRLKKVIDVEFDKSVLKTTKNTTVHGYPATKQMFNAVWDLSKHLPLFTKTRKSRSWFAAGYYKIRRNNKLQVVKCPKLIILQRYQSVGPFFTEQEAINNDSI